jgi:non-canonical purine NTP pyrophosphatase (RdgB/HAM1 family)
MNDFIFISGNQHKADYLAKWLGRPITHQKVDLDEIQSLDLRVVVEHKVREAYKAVKQPVLVEDIALTFHGMGRLPGPFIKWFLEDLGKEALAKLAAKLDTQAATASIKYALYDGEHMHIFAVDKPGRIAPEPRGDNDFGWGSIFIPDGSDKTYAEMTDEEMRPFNHRAQAIVQLKAFLDQSK